ncbi:D-alanyl-D-alanine carboxypeptidase family protein [Breznakiella homolactica]|uniref:D-alanyl-D-alanine carboxypeptidase family protein n=1 Tax=Breznakiella homolactica TaxID=2798577 RepID=UPI001CBA6968|nr:D-alanyl-D-alanine carboxypeptidase family protein [Breznakiella homolactica]
MNNAVLRRLPLFLWLFCITAAAGALDPGAAAPSLRSQAAVLLDAATGTVLYSKNGDEPISPASLTKLMTIHLALKDSESGKTSLDTVVSLPRETWAINQPPRSSLMFLAQGQTVTLGELLLGLAVSSGNDAAVAVALHLAPSVDAFAERMTAEAKALGLENTSFVEPSGISEYNMTTAMDYARFCRIYITLHPETLEQLHSVPSFAYPKPENLPEIYRQRPGTIEQYNRNALLRSYSGVDGLKTGYIDEAGYNIALTARRDGTRLIAVILGGPANLGSQEGERIRRADSTALLDWGFEYFKTLRPVVAELPPVRIWKGTENSASVVPGETLERTIISDRGDGLRWEARINEPVTAPLTAGSSVGDLVFLDTQGELFRVPLVLQDDQPQGNVFKRLWDSIRLFFRSLGKKN